MKTSSNRLADRYIRREDFADHIEGIELAPEVWAIFALFSESRSAEEIARLSGHDTAAANAAIRRLVRRKLLRKHVLSWRDYAATSQPSPAVGQPVAATPIRPATAPSAPASRPHLPATRPQHISFRIPPSHSTPRPKPVIRLRIAAGESTVIPRSAIEPADTTGWKLRPVLDAIGNKAGGGVAGQLLIYRVFLQIPTELMQAAGLHSLSLIDNEFTVRHQEFRDALVGAARKHAAVDIEHLSIA